MTVREQLARFARALPAKEYEPFSAEVLTLARVGFSLAQKRISREADRRGVPLSSLACAALVKTIQKGSQ